MPAHNIKSNQPQRQAESTPKKRTQQEQGPVGTLGYSSKEAELRAEITKAEQALFEANQRSDECRAKLNRAASDLKTAQEEAKKTNEQLLQARINLKHHHQLQVWAHDMASGKLSSELSRPPQPGAMKRVADGMRWVWSLLTNLFKPINH